MQVIIDIAKNKIIISCMLAWAIAQMLKILFELLFEKKFDLSRITGSGGMPSSHSSFVVALATAIGIIEGYTSSIFALSVGFAIIVMYDAAGVRRAAGKQASVLNVLINNINISDEIFDEKLKELIGHTPVEVIAGALLGFLTAIIICN